MSQSEETKNKNISEETPETEELEMSEQEVEDALLKLKDELGTLHDRYLRLGAEFENFKKRAERERQASVKFANEAILTELLPVLDHLEHALAAAQNDLHKENASESVKSLVKGTTMVMKQFEDVLAKFGVKSFSAVGQSFDPNMHEAMLHKIDDNSEPGIVLEEYQKGYLLNDRLVRPARVVVAKRS